MLLDISAYTGLLHSVLCSQTGLIFFIELPCAFSVDIGSEWASYPRMRGLGMQRCNGGLQCQRMEHLVAVER